MSHAVLPPSYNDDVERACSIDQRKPYTKPEIVHELQLETRAGPSLDSANPGTSPLQNPFDPRPNR